MAATATKNWGRWTCQHGLVSKGLVFHMVTIGEHYEPSSQAMITADRWLKGSLVSRLKQFQTSGDISDIRFLSLILVLECNFEAAADREKGPIQQFCEDLQNKRCHWDFTMGFLHRQLGEGRVGHVVWKVTCSVQWIYKWPHSGYVLPPALIWPGPGPLHMFSSLPMHFSPLTLMPWRATRILAADEVRKGVESDPEICWTYWDITSYTYIINK